MNPDSPDNENLTRPSTATEAADLTGRTLGDYSLIRRLGRGGMADVYLAEQLSLKRNVALKILKPDLARDQAYVLRFKNEAQAAAALAQSNIVQIYEVGSAEGLHFIAQEYVQGRNLRQYIARHGAVEPVMAINVLRQVTLALQKACESSVIHRDIKPENIMLSTTGEVKVADFGLARINNDAGRQDLTQIGITMGTPLYMSPEQVEGGAVDHRSDLYSLGVTTYHMLAGQPPFEGETALAIALQHVKNDPPSLQDIRPDVPAELCELISKLLAKNPDDRPQDATALRRELKKIKINVDEDWDDLVERLASAETSTVGTAPTLAESKLAVTRQLQSVMKGHVRSFWSWPMITAAIALPLIGLFMGIIMAQPTTDLLNPTEAQLETVSKRESVREQFVAALLTNGKADWKAVLDYFPAEEAQERNMTLLYHHWAQEKLGMIYLKEGQMDQALKTYSDLAALTDSRLSIVGLAGQAVTYHQLGKDDEARKCLQEVAPKKSELDEFFLSKVGELESLLFTN